MSDQAAANNTDPASAPVTAPAPTPTKLRVGAQEFVPRVSAPEFVPRFAPVQPQPQPEHHQMMASMPYPVISSYY